MWPGVVGVEADLQRELKDADGAVGDVAKQEILAEVMCCPNHWRLKKFKQNISEKSLFKT